MIEEIPGKLGALCLENRRQQIWLRAGGLLVTSIVPREVTMMSVEIPSIGFGQHGSGCPAPHPCQGGSEVPKAQGCFLIMESVELVQESGGGGSTQMSDAEITKQPPIHDPPWNHPQRVVGQQGDKLILNTAPIRACNPIGSQ